MSCEICFVYRDSREVSTRMIARSSAQYSGTMKAKVSRFVLHTSFMQMSYELCFVYSAAMKVTTGMNCANVSSETTSTAWM